jgi:sarcosine oxidase
MPGRTFDVAVIGAGVFGAWTAYQLRRRGADVLLVDAYGPGNSLASSGGESRIIRMGYGEDAIYTDSARRSLARWQALFEATEQTELFQLTGVLWLAREADAYCNATLETLRQFNIRHERLDRGAILERFPFLNPGEAVWGIVEPNSGVLLARRAVQAVVAALQAEGVTYLQDGVATVFSNITCTKVNSVNTTSGNEIYAGEFVFACGPWLPKLFPDLLASLIQVTRQEVLFFGTPAGAGLDHSPAWIDFNDLVYGIPNLDGRGYKIAIDAHGADFDPETGDRIVSEKSVTAVRDYLTRRIPRLADAPVIETRVCQYENTSNGDFLLDRHPDLENVWLAGGGSGHGFKHGPVAGDYVAKLISGDTKIEPRWTLATKKPVQQRQVF